MDIIDKENNYKFRIADKNDGEEIYDLIKKAFENYCANVDKDAPAMDETPEDIRNDIEENTVIVVEKEDQILATLRLERREKERVFLKRFAVLPDYQDRGLGTMLFQKAEKLVKEREYGNLIYLLSSLENQGLVKFYKKLGFKCQATDNERGYERGHWEKEVD